MNKNIIFRLLWITICSVSVSIANGNRIAYKMNLELIPDEHILKGKEKVIYTNLSEDTIRVIYFHLNPNGFRDRKSRTFQQYENMLSEPAALDIIKVSRDGIELKYSGDKTVSMKVELNSPLFPGDSTSLDIDFITRIPEGGHFFCPTHKGSQYSLFLFYPKVEYYYKKGWRPGRYKTVADPFGEISTFSVRLTLPANYTISGSLPIKRTETSGESKTIYFERKTLLDIGIACSDKYQSIAFYYDSIRVELLQSISRKDSLKQKTMPIFRDVVIDIIKLYSEMFTPYPYEHLCIVKGFVPGGYATSNYIVLDGGIFENVRKLDNSAVQTLAHEIGHEYFGFLINAHESYETWLNEGFANYAADLYMKKRFPALKKKYKKTVYQKVKSMPGDVMKIVLMSLERGNALNPVYTPEKETDFNSIIDLSKYYKGQKVLEMLSYKLGEKRFGQLMKHYIQEFSFKSASTDEFFALAEKVSGENLDNFKKRWVENIGVADVKISKMKSKTEPEGKVKNTITVDQDKPLYLPLEFRIVTINDDTIEVRKENLKFPRDTVQVTTIDKIRHVTVDPEKKIWELYRLNNRYPRKVRFSLPVRFPSVDTYEILTYPTIDFNDKDRFRVGLKIKGAYWIHLQPIFPAESFDDWYLELNYGYKSRTFGYEMGYSTSFLREFFKPRITLKASDYYGIEQRILQSSWYLGKIHYPLVSKVVGYKRFTSELIYQRVYDLKFTGSSSWEKGVSFVPTFTFINFHNWDSFRHVLCVEYRQGLKAFQADYKFQQLTGEVVFKTRIHEKQWYYSRVFSGMTWGNMPVQRALYFFGKNIFQNQSFYNIRQVKGMGDMRGYGNQSIRGKAILSANNELHYSILQNKQLYLDILTFYDIGWVGEEISSLKFGQAKSDAGFGLEIDFFEYIKAGFHLPIFVSHPVSGEKQWKLRWVVSYKLNF